MSRIKICGLTRQKDIDFVNEAKPDYIGFVFAPSKRQVEAAQAFALRKRLSPEIRAVGVFVDAPISQIRDICEKKVLDCVQLHGREDSAYIRALREHIRLPVIKAVSMSKPIDLKKLDGLDADYLLFDQGSGGSGQTFDWDRLPKVDKPFFLAGGLNPNNLSQAIEAVKPFAVDLSSGVESGGVKDREKIMKAVRSVRNE